MEETLVMQAALTMTATEPVAQSPGPTIGLGELERGASGIVAAIGSPANEEGRELVRRLIEIGFVPGETLRVIAHGQPGNEPIAVRLGGTTFALRRLEAAYIRVVRKFDRG